MLQCLIRGHIQLAAAAEVAQHGIAQVGIDGGGAEADESGDLVGVTCRGGGNQDVGVAAQTFFAEVMVDRAGGQQGMDRQLGRPAVLVGEQDEDTAGADRLGGLEA